MADDLALDTVEQADATPQKAVRRWLLEIKLAEKREKEWRGKARDLLKTYRGESRKKNTFNILWANTEVLRPALYNSTPKPDVRRRFRQNDVLGKAVGEVMERSLAYCVDAYDLDNCLQNDVLDALLPGRGIARVRYVPIYKATPGTKPSDEAPHIGEGFEGDREEVEYEQALCEHVQWDDFLHGPGKTWEEVQWTGFRERLTKDDLIEKFGKEVANKIRLDDVDESDLNDNKHADDLKEVFKRAECWEVWDKQSGKVFFVNESHKAGVLYAVDTNGGEPPLRFKNFFPCPRPLMLVEDTGNLVPSPLYELYRKQAEELDNVSGRINKIINACRVRFAHDPTLTELSALMSAGDNEGIPVENARAWMANGGIEKAIWWMPVQQVAVVLKELYEARDQSKEVIHELTGISDILRGSTDPNETLGAQQLKANSSSLRLQRQQREVQRYSRDLIRLLGEVIADNFSTNTLGKMTGMQFPTAIMKQQAQLQMQGQQQIPGQPPAPPNPQVMQMLQMPTWEDILGVLQNDMEREFRVDIETDSTVAQSLQQDMAGLKDVLTAIVEFWQGAGPAVQAQAVSMDAVKAITMTIARRARMGLEVEDALESGMQQPKPQSDPKAQQAQAEAQANAQLEQQKMQFEQQSAQAKLQNEQAIAQREAQIAQQRASYEAQLEQQRALFQMKADDAKSMRDDATARYKIDADNKAKIEVAEIAADATMNKAQADAADQESAKFDASVNPAPKKPKPLDVLLKSQQDSQQKTSDQLEQHAKMIQDLHAAVNKPKRLRVTKRGPDGRISEAETVQ